MNRIDQAVILAGGKGTRLGQLTDSIPKPLLEVGGQPFLGHLIWNLKRHGIKRIIFSVGYLSQRIMTYFRDGSRFGVSIDYSIEKELAGTGGAILLNREKLDAEFMVLNGDTLFDINYLDLAANHESGTAMTTISLRELSDKKRYGAVVLEGNRITGFSEKSGIGKGLVNGGIYAIQKKALDLLPPPPCSLEHDLFPVIAKHGGLAGKIYEGFFIDIGLPETLNRANTLLPLWRKKAGIFFAMDANMLNGLASGDQGIDESQFIQMAQTIKGCNDNGFLVFVLGEVQNKNILLDFLNKSNEKLRPLGAHIDDAYFPTNLSRDDTAEEKSPGDSTKPSSAMIRLAIDAWTLDYKASVFVTNNQRDGKKAESLGISWLLRSEPDLILAIKRLVTDNE